MAGCVTSEVNPPAPKANKGYADFYAEPAGEICWRIEERDDRTTQFKQLYSKFSPPEHGIVRLELPPGHHRFQITFLNLATEGPVEAEVDIVAEKICPVAVRRESGGETYVRTVEDKARHGGRRREVTDDQQQIYRLLPIPQPTQGYETKDKMRYTQ
jgi:hypothetical protein